MFSWGTLALVLSLAPLQDATATKEDPEDFFGVQFEARPATRSMCGAVLINGQTVDGLRIKVAGDESSSTRADSHARFFLGAVPQAEFVLEIYCPSDEGFSRLAQQRIPEGASCPGIMKLELSALPVPVELKRMDGGEAWWMRLELARASDGQVEPMSAWAITNLKGHATLYVSTPGRYRIVAERWCWARAVTFVDVGPMGSAPVCLEVASAVPCSGTLLSSGEDDWRHLYFEAIPEHPEEAMPEAVMYSWTAPNVSNFTMGNVIPGRYRARIFVGDGKMLQSEEFEVPEAGTKDLVLRFGSRP